MSMRMKLLLIGSAALLLAGVGVAQATSRQAAPTSRTHYVVDAGWGQDDYSANIYKPLTIHVYVGDTVTWRVTSPLEAHTITFGPMPLLKRLVQNEMRPVPQRAGPPQLEFNAQVAFPTHSATYAGSGFANSGLLTQGQKWSLTFTRPGRYRYYCLTHFPGMSGVVVAYPRPAPSHTYRVQAGYEGAGGASAADAFFPENLTIHTGDSVIWRGVFHTITFAPASTAQRLRHQFIVAIPQKAGPPHLIMNPAIAYPQGGSTYDGNGVLSSGLLLLRRNTFRATFTKPGVYRYYCLVHPGMDGTIRVLP